MVRAFRDTVMALTSLVVAGSNILRDFMNSYLACGLALTASITAGFCVECAFIRRPNREMARLHREHSAEGPIGRHGPE